MIFDFFFCLGGADPKKKENKNKNKKKEVMALPSVLQLLILSTLALNWYRASGAAVVNGRAVEEVNYHQRRE